MVLWSPRRRKNHYFEASSPFPRMETTQTVASAALTKGNKEIFAEAN